MAPASKKPPPREPSPRTEDETEETPVVSRPSLPAHRPIEHVEVATDVGVEKPELGSTPARATPATPAGSRKSSSEAEVRPATKPGGRDTIGRFAERRFRLPTPSEISDAVEGTPTERVPVVPRRNLEDTDLD